MVAFMLEKRGKTMVVDMEIKLATSKGSTTTEAISKEDTRHREEATSSREEVTSSREEATTTEEATSADPRAGISVVEEAATLKIEEAAEAVAIKAKVEEAAMVAIRADSSTTINVEKVS